MPKTLLAIDDSITMRKVLEITFAGEDFRVVGADGSQSALARMSEGPVAAVIDTAIADDGYALAKELRSRDPRLAIVLLSSRYSPYDANRGRDAGADDYADKPFDTQALIDKVKKAIVARENLKPAAAPAPSPVAAAPVPAQPIIVPPAPPPQRPLAPQGLPQRAAASTPRTHTLSFEGGAPTQGAPPPIARTAPSGTPIVQSSQIRPGVTASAPAPVPIEHMARTAVPPRPPDPATSVPGANGQLASKLVEMGLTPQQVDAVLALSHEVIERVVWEVVPQLAEAMIKEEIARLTKDG